MVISDLSIQPLFGKEDDLIAVAKDFVAYYNLHWPAPLPRRVVIDLTGEGGRVHIIAVWPTLADHERSDAEQQADPHVKALIERFNSLMVPGSLRSTFQRDA